MLNPWVATTILTLLVKAGASPSWVSMQQWM